MIDYVALAAQRNASRGLDETKVSSSKDKIIAARKEKERRYNNLWRKKKWAKENSERKKASNLEYLNRNKELLRVKGIVRYQVRCHPEVLQGHTMRELYEIEFKIHGIEFPYWSKRFCDWLDKVDGVCNENGNTAKDN